MNPNNSTKLDREDEKRMLPCRFYANGFCHRGGRCRFYHPAISAIKSAMKVPPLPANFGHGVSLSSSSPHMNGLQHGYSPMNLDQRMRTSSNSSTQLASSGSQRSGNGRSGMNYNFGFATHPSVLNFNQEFDFDYSSQSSPCESSSSDLSVASEHNTYFTHINWLDFLAPGQIPPPLIKVPEMPLSAKLDSEPQDLSSGDGKENNPVSSSSEDVSSEGSKCAVDENGQKKLTPREELQLKVKQIAKELAAEPAVTNSVIDSYFLGYDFVTKGFTHLPPKPSTTVAATKSDL